MDKEVTEIELILENVTDHWQKYRVIFNFIMTRIDEYRTVNAGQVRNSYRLISFN
jgi:hypothetical protein